MSTEHPYEDNFIKQMFNHRVEHNPTLNHALLGEMAGLSQAVIRGIECANQRVYLDDAVKIADALRMTVDSMVEPWEPDRRQELRRLTQRRHTAAALVEAGEARLAELDTQIRKLTEFIERDGQVDA